MVASFFECGPIWQLSDFAQAQSEREQKDSIPLFRSGTDDPTQRRKFTVRGMMTVLLIIMLLWCAVSVVAGIFIGKFIKWGMGN